MFENSLKLLSLHLLGIIFIPFATCQAQEEESYDFIENPRPKVLQYEFRMVTASPLRLQSQQYGDVEIGGVINEKTKFSAEVPLVLQSKHQLILSLRASEEEIEFKQPGPPDHLFYQRIQENALHSLGAKLVYRRKVDDKRCWLVQAGINLPGDQNRWLDAYKYLRSSALFIYTKQKNARTTIGYGVYMTYEPLRPRAYPAFIYQRNMGRHWRLDLALPKSAELQYAFSPKMYAYASAEFGGSTYFLPSDRFSTSQNLRLNYNELQMGLRVEREVYDWLWVGASWGAIQNFGGDLSEFRSRPRDRLIQSKGFFSDFFQISVFCVPPKKLLDKMK